MKVDNYSFLAGKYIYIYIYLCKFINELSKQEKRYLDRLVTDIDNFWFLSASHLALVPSHGRIRHDSEDST